MQWTGAIRIRVQTIKLRLKHMLLWLVYIQKSPEAGCLKSLSFLNFWFFTVHNFHPKQYKSSLYRSDSVITIDVISFSTEIVCGEPPILSLTVHIWNGRVTFNSTVTYHCKHGYYAKQGRNISVCAENGYWTKPTLLCEGNCLHIFLNSKLTFFFFKWTDFVCNV